MRVACYIDGFNFYHALDDLAKPHLKWVDLWSLSKSLCRPGETLAKVAYFSAFATWRPDAYARHRQYVAALNGVECHMARFSEQTARCRTCGSTWKRHEEKETDVHFSLTFLEDAIDNVFDRAIVISADSDHVPAIRKIKTRLPRKQLFAATPPGRHKTARGILAECHSGMEITAGRVARHLFPQAVLDAAGQLVTTRPASYDPPPGWTPPK
jgi:hypothetical protein